jgi:hypothetical protein
MNNSDFNNNNNNNHTALPIIAVDFEQRVGDGDGVVSFDRFHMLFFIAYIIAIPIILFVVSQCIRCLRRRGVVIVSESSEECILDECRRHLNRGIGVANPASIFRNNSPR